MSLSKHSRPYALAAEWKIASQNLLDFNRVERYQAYCPVCFRPLLKMRFKNGKIEGMCGTGHIEEVFLTGKRRTPV